MNIVFSPDAIADLHHLKQNEPKVAKRIKELLANILDTPFGGKGHPEPLKFGLAGYWSRRITAEHRLVYRVENDALYVVSCRYHYR